MEPLKPALQNQRKLSVPIQCTIGFDEYINNLLNNCIPKNKQIDLIDRHYDAIIDARQRKITWDNIAATLNVSRSTLINAIKAIKVRRADKSSNSFISLPLHRPIDAPPFIGASDRQPIKTSNESFINQGNESDSGLKVLGRAQIQNFNI